MWCWCWREGTGLVGRMVKAGLRRSRSRLGRRMRERVFGGGAWRGCVLLRGGGLCRDSGRFGSLVGGPWSFLFFLFLWLRREIENPSVRV